MKTKPVSVSAKKKNSARITRPRTADELPPEKPAATVKTLTSPAKPTRASKPKSGTTAVRRAHTRRKKIEVPAILLEGDAPAIAPVSGPGEKYALGPTTPAQKFDSAEAELPEAYGTKKLFLTARDPHWLYTHWDLTREQQLKFNAKSADGHLVLRIYANKIEGHPAYEIHVHPESNHWFAHVERAGNSYAAELGYYSSIGKWIRVSVSSGTVTPPDAVSTEADAEFATIPFEFPFARLMEMIKAAVRENLPLAQAIEELRRSGHRDLPRVNGSPISAWTPQQEQALAKVISIDETRRVWMGSLEITELIRRRLQHDISSLGISSLSSPFGGIELPKNFWFNVNAELIIYGATEPGAKVTLGGHEIKLRSDGTFSFRFALPDGKYDLPAVAVSADGTDARAADLKFTRETEYLGDVGAHPQDPALKTPLPENT
ncbi:MAG TPA: DUF4912 domain-containing protein [Verrucomicrobiae bacterium]|nr:DUF4912 domain-containing protein [Verrucomicrobiae bacterium]